MSKSWVCVGSYDKGYVVGKATEDDLINKPEAVYTLEENAELTCKIINEFWMEDSSDDAYERAYVWRAMLEIMRERGMVV